MLTRYSHGLSAANKGYVDPSAGVHVTRTVFNRRDIVIPLKYTDGTTAVTTNFTIPENCVVLPYPYVNIRTAETTGTTKTFTVGITGTAAAFINGLSAATAGLIQPVLANGAVTLGTDLFEYAGATSTEPVRLPYIPAAAVSLIWTPGSADWAEFDADLILPVLQMVDMTNLPVNADIANIDLGM